MIFTLQSHLRITETVFDMRLAGDTRAFVRPGQFVQVQVPGFYLRRPISVCQWTPGERGELRLVYRVAGHGTDAMSAMKPGSELDLLTGLGNGFDVTRCGDAPLLAGGGVGVPPLLGLCQALLEAGKRPRVALGFRTGDDAILAEDFRALGVETALATEDGSLGVRGFVTALIDPSTITDLCACGPVPMLKALHGLYKASGTPGQYSLESRMACGFGACMGCTITTLAGPMRVCKEGPVFPGEVLAW